MSSVLTRTLSTSVFGLVAAPGRKALRPVAGFATEVFADRPALQAMPETRRIKIWELARNLHCSIVGTCLSGGELRQLLVRLDITGAQSGSDHDLHEMGVLLASSREGGAKFLQKALDRRHRGIINQFAKAKDADALAALWVESVKRGEIPGAYWAVLTHPAATEATIRRAFSDVHMLSHLVGAANRADIVRLRQLEQDNAALTAKLDRQQRQLRDGFTARDETIRRLNDMLVRNVSRTAGTPSPAECRDDGAGVVENVVAEMDKRLAGEAARRERLERRLAASAQTLQAAEHARRLAERERDALRRELESIEDRIGALLQPEDGALAVGLDLSGITVLYVGGRAHPVPQLKDAVERTGAQFLHHDGGIEHSTTLLPGLVSRADLTVFPVDCVSHEAMTSVKRHCRQSAKPYMPLRTSSLTSLLSALSSVRRSSEPAVAEA